MNAQILVINFFTIVASLTIFYLVKNYFPSYFGEKGKNQATKEDIGEITDIVETIKSDLLQQNELLKAQLSFSNQHRLNVKSAEREALFEFNNKISAWIFSVLRFNLSVFNLSNYKEIKIASSEFSKRQYECDLAESHLLLFMHDEKFLQLKKELTISIIKLEGVVENAMQDVYGVYSKCELEVEMAGSDLRKQSEARGGIYKELRPLLDAHRTNRTDEYRKVHSLHASMTQLISQKLKLLEE